MNWTRRAALVLAALLGAGGISYPLFGRALLLRHISRASGRAEQEVVGCWSCHLPRRAAELRRGLPHPAPAALALAPDGRRLYIACGPIRRVIAVDLAALREVDALDLPGRPRGLALSADGATLCVTLADAARVAVLDAEPLAVRATIPVGREPAGLAFADGGRRLFVAAAGGGEVSVLDPVRGVELRRVRAGREPWAVAASPDGTRVAVVSRMAEVGPADAVPLSELTLLDGRDGTVAARIALPSCHLAESLAWTADGSRILIPAVRVRNLLPILQVARGWVMSSVLAVVDPATSRVSLLPLNEPNTPFPDPTALALGPRGELFLAAGGSDEIAALDLAALLALAGDGAGAPAAPERAALAARYLTMRFAVGDHPSALALIGEGADAVLAVAERLDDTVAFYDLAGGLRARIPLGRPVREDAVHRGDRVFHEAAFAFQGAFSCRSCHPGGHTDGLAYDFDVDGVGRNVVLNRSLRGVAGTAPFKWNGRNPTLQRQCGPRFAMVLTRADPFPEAQLEDLVAYLESLPPPEPAPDAGRIGGRTTGALARGAALFAREIRKDGSPIPPEGRCVTCHPPPLYSNLRTAEVGTQGPLDDVAAFDVPHLNGIGSKAPYLHDGRARTLEEIWTLPGVLDRHGVVTDLTKSDLNDLVEFLKGL